MKHHRDVKQPSQTSKDAYYFQLCELSLLITTLPRETETENRVVVASEGKTERKEYGERKKDKKNMGKKSRGSSASLRLL